MTALTKVVESADPTAGLHFNQAGLVCAVVQQFDSKEVLMVAWMDAEALRRTLDTGAATYYSRSRQSYWVKGETSGNTQRVVEVRRDCDGDTLLVLVDQQGVACHTGSRTCFDDGLIGRSAP
jgi:phosphoribosyl-AMP cyclohydrolase